MFSWLIKTLKPFIWKMPLFTLLFFFSWLVSHFYDNVKEISCLLYFIFICDRFWIYLTILYYNHESGKQWEKFRSSTYHVKWLKLWRSLRRIFMGKAAIKPRIETTSLLVKLIRIPFIKNDRYSTELREQHNKVIDELITINIEIRKAENLDDMKLRKRFEEKHSEYVDIYSKYLKHTKKM